MKLKSVLVAGVLGLSSLSLAACSGASTSADAEAAAPAEPTASEIAFNTALEACHVAVAATDGWRELDQGEMYELAKDVVRDNTEAGTSSNNTRYLVAHCARNMANYAGGGEAPAGITAE